MEISRSLINSLGAISSVISKYLPTGDGEVLLKTISHTECNGKKTTCKSDVLLRKNTNDASASVRCPLSNDLLHKTNFDANFDNFASSTEKDELTITGKYYDKDFSVRLEIISGREATSRDKR